MGTHEQIVVEAEGRGIDGLLLGLEKLGSELTRTHSKALGAAEGWGKTTRALSNLEIFAKTASREVERLKAALSGFPQGNALNNLQIRASAAGNIERLDAAYRGLAGSSAAALQPLGRSVGALMRVQSTASAAADPIRALGRAYALLATNSSKITSLPKMDLAGSYAGLKQNIDGVVKSLDDLAAAYTRAGAAQRQAFPSKKLPAGGAGGVVPADAIPKTPGRGFATSVGSYIARFGTAAGIVAGGRQIAEYEDNIAALGATLDLGTKQLEVFREQAIKTAQDSRISLTDASASLLALSRGGISKPNELQVLAPAVSKAAVAGQMSADDTTRLAINLMAQFKKKASDVPDMLGKVTKAANISVIGFQEIGVSMKYAGEAAATLGTDFNTTLAAISTLGQLGKQGSTGGTTLRQMMNQLAVGNEKTTTFLDAVAKKTGVARDKLDITKNSLIDVLEALKDAQPTARDLFATFDKQGGSGFISLVNNVDMLKEHIAQIDASGFEEVERVAARMNDTLGGQARRMTNTLIASGAKANTALGDPFKHLFSFVADSLTKISNLGDSVDELSKEWPILGSAIKAVGVALMGLTVVHLTKGFAAALANVSMFRDAVAGLKSVFLQANAGASILSKSNLFATLKANAPLLLALAAYAAAKNYKTGEGSSLLDNVSDLTGSFAGGARHVMGKISGDTTQKHELTGNAQIDELVRQRNAALAAAEAATKKGESKSTIETYTKEFERTSRALKDMDYEHWRALAQQHGQTAVAVSSGQHLRQKEYLRELQRAQADEMEAFKEDLTMLNPGEDVLSGKKGGKRNINEIAIELEKSREEVQRMTDGFFSIRTDTEVARSKIADELEGILKTFKGLDADQKLPEIYRSALERIKEDPNQALQHFRTVQVAVNSGDYTFNKSGGDKKAKSLADTMVSIAEIAANRERVADLELQKKKLDELKSAATSAQKEIGTAADQATAKTSRSVAAAFGENTLMTEYSRILEQYRDKTQAILDYADALDKAGMASKAMSEREKLVKYDADLFKIAQDRAQTEATKRFQNTTSPMNERLRNHYGGSTLLELDQNIKEMQRLRDISQEVSRIDYKNGNISLEQMNQQLDAANAKFRQFEKLANDQTIANWARDSAFAMTDVFGQGVQTMFDAMVDGAKNMEDVFKGVVKSIISALFRVMVVEKMVDALKMGINQAFPNIASSVSSGVSAAFSGGAKTGMDGMIAADTASALRAATWPTARAANDRPASESYGSKWLTQSSRNLPPTPTEAPASAAASATTGPYGEVRSEGSTTVNQNITIKAPNPNSFRQSTASVGRAARRIGRS